jgi:hypothetical protein
MSYIGPNGYNFDYLIPENYNNTVRYIYGRTNSPTGYYGYNGDYVIFYGDIAGCTGPTGRYYQEGRDRDLIMDIGIIRNGPSGPPRTF